MAGSGLKNAREKNTCDALAIKRRRGCDQHAVVGVGEAARRGVRVGAEETLVGVVDQHWRREEPRKLKDDAGQAGDKGARAVGRDKGRVCLARVGAGDNMVNGSKCAREEEGPAVDGKILTLHS